MKTYNSLQLAGVQLIMGVNACSAVPELLEKAGVRKPVLITDTGIRKSGILAGIVGILQKSCIDFEVYDKVESDPDDRACEEAAAYMRQTKCDSVIAVGGGSVMDTAKAAKVLINNEGCIFDYDNSPTGGKRFRNRGQFLICIPTTSGTGCEVTPYVIITNREEERKATINSSYLLADAAILDPCLTKNMPPFITACTGMDALAHAIGGYTSCRTVHAGGTTKISDILELEAIRLVGENLRKCVRDGEDMEARLNMMIASTIGGIVISAGGDAAHGLGHALGSIYHIPHGCSCAMMVAAVMEYNCVANPGRFADIAKALGVATFKMSEMEAAKAAAEEVRRLREDIGIPHLSDYLEKTEGERFEKMCRIAAQEKCSQINLREITEEKAKELYVKVYQES